MVRPLFIKKPDGALSSAICTAGLPEAVANADGSRGYRMDGAMQRPLVA
jgi:hypothetical protein